MLKIQEIREKLQEDVDVAQKNLDLLRRASQRVNSDSSNGSLQRNAELFLDQASAQQKAAIAALEHAIDRLQRFTWNRTIPEDLDFS